MPVNLSVKNVPDDLAALLRERAKRHRRSLQGELLVILEESLTPRPLTIEQLDREVRARGLETPAESAAMVRENRDAG